MGQTSTAVSDLVLALTCLYSVHILQSVNYDWLSFGLFQGQTSLQYKYASTGFISVFIAATFGIFRFGLSYPSNGLVQAHTCFSWIATVVGVPLIASEYIFTYSSSKQYVIILWIASAVTVTTWTFLSGKTRELVSLLLSGASVLSVGTLSFLFSNNWSGLLGSILVAASGAILANKRTIMGLPSVDWFHYVFAVAIYCLSKGLL